MKTNTFDIKLEIIGKSSKRHLDVKVRIAETEFLLKTLKGINDDRLGINFMIDFLTKVEKMKYTTFIDDEKEIRGDELNLLFYKKGNLVYLKFSGSDIFEIIDYRDFLSALLKEVGKYIEDLKPLVNKNSLEFLRLERLYLALKLELRNLLIEELS